MYLEKIVKNNNQIVKKTCRIEKKVQWASLFYKIQIKVKESLWNLIKCIKKVKYIVRKCEKEYYIQLWEKDDWEQEGR